MAERDPICKICGARKSEHTPFFSETRPLKIGPSGWICPEPPYSSRVRVFQEATDGRSECNSWGYAFNFGLSLLWTQGLLRDAQRKIADLERENLELRNELAKREVSDGR
jgi:hypothetical protein